MYAEVCRVGETLPGGDKCYRDQAVGDRLPSDRNAPLSPIDELVLVTVVAQPDDDEWHALYCPGRALLVGPLSDFYRYTLQEDYDLLRDDDGVWHLCRWSGPQAVCGAEPAPPKSTWWNRLRFPWQG